MLTLAAAKASLRIDHSDDDALIETLIAASGDHLSAIGVDMTADPLPASLTQAQLMLVGHFFTNPEATTDAKTITTPLGVDRLIAPYREQGI